MQFVTGLRDRVETRRLAADIVVSTFTLVTLA
jgi:hypothetical protein